MTNAKMLQAILDSVASMRKEVRHGFKEVNEKIDKLTKRIDKIGSQVAYLEDDTPTIDEHNKLGKRVEKLEKEVASP